MRVEAKSVQLKLLLITFATFFLIMVMSACSDSPKNATPKNIASLQEFDIDGVPAAPAWVAFKDGDGPWEQITTPSADMVWSHTVIDSAGRYAFAAVSGSEQSLEIYAGTISELSHFYAPEFPASLPETQVSVSGAVSGVPTGASWNVAVGPRLTHGPTSDSAVYAVGLRTPGRTDILAARTADSGAIDRLWLNRNLLVQQKFTRNIDFADPALSDAGVATEVPLSSPNLVDGGAMYFTGRAGIPNGWGIASAVWEPSALWYLTPSAAQAQPGDVQCVWGDTGAVRLTDCAAPGSVPALDFTGLPVFAGASLSDRTLRWFVYPGAQLYEFQLTPPRGLYVDVRVTPGAAGAMPSLDIPDLSQVAGWKSSWTVNLDSVTVMGSAIASNVSAEQMLLQSAVKRYQAGYRGWVAEGLPPGYGAGGASYSADCDTCVTNCYFNPNPCDCVSTCDLLPCGTYAQQLSNELCP